MAIKECSESLSKWRCFTDSESGINSNGKTKYLGRFTSARDVWYFTYGTNADYGGVILAFSQLIAYAWLDVP